MSYLQWFCVPLYKSEKQKYFFPLMTRLYLNALNIATLLFSLGIGKLLCKNLELLGQHSKRVLLDSSVTSSYLVPRVISECLCVVEGMVADKDVVAICHTKFVST